MGLDHQTAPAAAFNIFAQRIGRDAIVGPDLNERAGSPVSKRYAAEFKKMNETLAEFPESGPLRKGLGRYARIKVVLPYVVYDFAGDLVTVLRVLHGQRNITKKLITR